MPRRLALLLALALPAAPARAQPGVQVVQTGPRTFDDFLAGLLDPDPDDRLFAARELRRRVRRAVHAAARGNPDRLVVAQALTELEDYDRHLAPRCVEVLENRDDFANVVVPCADVLRLLETREALPALRAALAAETRRRPRRRLERAILAIEASEERPAEAAP